MANNKPTRICSIDGCKQKHRARGYCGKHYQRAMKSGEIAAKEIKCSTPEESFALRTERRGECLIWTGATDGGGYGTIYINSRATGAHRYSYERHVGPIPAGMMIDHARHCSPACVEPTHLRLVTAQQNTTNLSKAHSDSVSKLRNVGYRPETNKWRVRLHKDGVLHNFGQFDSPEEAAQVAERARKELFGEFAGKG